MKNKILTIFSLLSMLLLCGCLQVSKYSFFLDYRKGEVERKYHDITSVQGVDEKNYSVENDWEGLREMVNSKEPESPSVVTDVSKKLFREGEVLSAKKTLRVKCPHCFPSKVALLAYLHDNDWRFEAINNEIFLFLPSGKKALSSNGKIISTTNNSMIVWPDSAIRFEYVVAVEHAEGKKLLPYFLKDKNFRKRDKKN